MRRIFREKWTSKWADKNPEESKRKYEELKSDYDFVLRRLTQDQVAWGLKQCLDNDEIDFPPVPKDFYRLAKSYVPPLEQLEKQSQPKANQKQVTQCLKEINQILGRKSKFVESDDGNA